MELKRQRRARTPKERMQEMNKPKLQNDFYHPCKKLEGKKRKKFINRAAKHPEAKNNNQQPPPE